MVTSAILLKMMVLARCVGFVNLANMMPVMQAWAAPHIASHIVCRYLFRIGRQDSFVYRDEDPHDALHAHHEDGRRALGRGHAAAVPAQCAPPLARVPVSRVRLPDGVLSLHAEQEGRAEVRHVVHAGHVLGAGGGAQVPCRVDIYCLQSRYVCWSPCCQAIRYQTMPNMNHEAK